MKLTDDPAPTPSLRHPPPAGTPGAGPSSANGHTKNGHAPASNGVPRPSGSGRPTLHQVSLPGTRLYEGSHVDREEYVRLVIQSLRDIGYMCVVRPFDLPASRLIVLSHSESAATLEAESGYVMESPQVAEFRQCILEASWTQAEAALLRIGVPGGHPLAVRHRLRSGSNIALT
jgi:hypothetical protein